MQLPEPSAAARAVSEELTALILERLRSRGGFMPFDEYMEMALYEPGLGYYSAGSTKIGHAGDFVTAPEISEFLARAVADSFGAALGTLPRPGVLELGAGTGRLAGQLVECLEACCSAAFDYRILETSADLRDRQARHLASLGQRVGWLDSLPASAFEGLILANEVADALPVGRFVVQDGIARPLGVAAPAGRLGWAVGDRDEGLEQAVVRLEAKLGSRLPDGYESELCFRLPAWIAQLGRTLSRGALLIIDYGLARRDYYHPDRHAGTLICHYRHRAHDDPFLFPGLQDMSAWVDFSAAAESARDAGLELCGYTTQSSFILEYLERGGARLVNGLSVAAREGLKTLVLPGQMGERFKVMLLTKQCDRLVLPGRDFRDAL
jgi:SAM-dependent MidA family methyltransferase